MADLDPISTVRPIHPNQQRPPRNKRNEENQSKDQPSEKPRDEPHGDSDHQVDDYA